MTNVRLRYSGFILFLSRLISVGTGLLFTLMITRNISTEEFGIFGNISDLLFYFTLLSGIIPFWTSRFVAREYKNSSSTGIFTNFLVAIPCIFLYLLLLPNIMGLLKVSKNFYIVYIVVAFEILEVYLVASFESVLQSNKPQAVGYGLIIYEFIKIVIGYFLIIQSKLGLIGIISSIILALSIKILYYLRLIFKDLNVSIEWSYVREWIQGSPLNFYTIVGQRLAGFHLIILFALGSSLARSYYAAASTIAGIIGYTSAFSYPLYPRLLSDERTKDIQSSTKMVLTFAIPMTTGAIILARPYLTILGEKYVVAWSSLIILALDALIMSLSKLFDTVISGTEKIDANGKILKTDLLKSSLFKLQSLFYVKAGLILPSAYFMLKIIKSPVEAVLYLTFIILSADLILLIARYILAKKSLQFRIPWINTLKYAGSSAIMGICIIFLPAPNLIFQTLLMTILGGIIYLAILNIVDQEFRYITRYIIDYFRKRYL